MPVAPTHAGEMATPTFPSFARLPAEIRLMIWQEALPAPRVYEIMDAPHAKQKTPAQQGLMFNNRHHEPPPAMATVCREARAVVLRSYRPLTLGGTTKFVDVSRDLVLLEPYLLVKRLLRSLHFLAQIPLLRDRLARLALGTSYGLHTGICHPILSWKVSKNNMAKLLAKLACFPKLRTIVFVVHQDFHFDFDFRIPPAVAPPAPNAIPPPTQHDQHHHHHHQQGSLMGMGMMSMGQNMTATLIPGIMAPTAMQHSLSSSSYASSSSASTSAGPSTPSLSPTLLPLPSSLVHSGAPPRALYPSQMPQAPLSPAASTASSSGIGGLSPPSHATGLMTPQSGMSPPPSSASHYPHTYPPPPPPPPPPQMQMQMQMHLNHQSPHYHHTPGFTPSPPPPSFPHHHHSSSSSSLPPATALPPPPPAPASRPQTVHQAYRFKFDIEASINHCAPRRPHNNQLLYYPLDVADDDANAELLDDMMGLVNDGGADGDGSSSAAAASSAEWCDPWPTNDDWRRFKKRFQHAVKQCVSAPGARRAAGGPHNHVGAGPRGASVDSCADSLCGGADSKYAAAPSGGSSSSSSSSSNSVYGNHGVGAAGRGIWRLDGENGGGNGRGGSGGTGYLNARAAARAAAAAIKPGDLLPGVGPLAGMMIRVPALEGASLLWRYNKGEHL